MYHTPSIGNRIDQRLANGLVKQLLTNAKRFEQTTHEALYRVQDAGGSLASRKQALVRLHRGISQAGGKVVGNKDVKRFRTAMVIPVPTTTANGQLVGVVHFDRSFDAPNAPLQGRLLMQTTSHALVRFVQRTGQTELPDLNDFMLRAAAWAAYAPSLTDGLAMVPIEEGLACFAVEREYDREVWKTTGRAVMTTVISKDEMTTANRELWQNMVDRGALTMRPKLPTFKVLNDAQAGLLREMVKAGANWEKRREHAIQMKQEQSRGVAPNMSMGF